MGLRRRGGRRRRDRRRRRRRPGWRRRRRRCRRRRRRRSPAGGRSAGEVLHPVEPVGAADGDAHADRAERRILDVGAMAGRADPGRHHIGRRLLAGRDVLTEHPASGVAAIQHPGEGVARDGRSRIVVGEIRVVRHVARLPDSGVRERRIDRERSQAERRPVLVDERDDLLGERRVGSRPGRPGRAGGSGAERAGRAQGRQRGRDNAHRDRCGDEDAHSRHAPPVCGQRFGQGPSNPTVALNGYTIRRGKLEVPAG